MYYYFLSISFLSIKIIVFLLYYLTQVLLLLLYVSHLAFLVFTIQIVCGNLTFLWYFTLYIHGCFSCYLPEVLTAIKTKFFEDCILVIRMIAFVIRRGSNCNVHLWSCQSAMWHATRRKCLLHIKFNISETCCYYQILNFVGIMKLVLVASL